MEVRRRIAIQYGSCKIPSRTKDFNPSFWTQLMVNEDRERERLGLPSRGEEIEQRKRKADEIKRALFKSDHEGGDSQPNSSAKLDSDQLVHPVHRDEFLSESELGGNQCRSKQETGPHGPFGRSVADIFTHSWRDEPRSYWVWIPKHAGIGDKGYPVTKAQIAREGWKARQLVRVPPPKPLTKSFVSVLREGEMSHEQDFQSGRRMAGQDGGFKRSYEAEGSRGRRDAMLEQDNSRGGSGYRDDGGEEDLRLELEFRERNNNRLHQAGQYGGDRFG